MKTESSRRLWYFASGLVFIIGAALILIAGLWLARSCDEDINYFVKPLFDDNSLQMRYINGTDHTQLALINVGLSSSGTYSELNKVTGVVDGCDFESVLATENLEICKTINYQNEEGENGNLVLQISKIDTNSNNKDFTCYETTWYSSSSWLMPTDCIALEHYHDYWNGGAEIWSKHMSFFLSGDMFNDDQQYGSLLDRYWMSSKGVGLFVKPKVPLHVATENNQICLKGSYTDYPHQQSLSYDWLQYTMCFSSDARTTHDNIIQKKLHYKTPTDLPDLRMIKSPIWSTWAQYKVDINQTIILQYANEINSNGFSNSQLEIDDGYETYYGDFTFDTNKFPDAVGMISQLHDMGFRVTTWVTPFINPTSHNYQEGVNQGYFVKNGDGSAGRIAWWNGIGSMIDFTNPEACDWYVNILNQVRNTYGVDSFKFDAGEINYLTAVPGYSTHETMSNLGEYTSAYAICARRLGIQIELRAAWNTQDLPVFVRMMDKDSNWLTAKGLKTLIPTALTFSVLGYPYILPDMIGGNGYESGFHGKYIPERELYIRWLQITAFFPNMQFSITPWQYDDDVVMLAQKYVELHEGEIYDEIKRSSEDLAQGKSSLGPIRPIWWISPNDKNSFDIDDQFLVGNKYLVAPIVNNATTHRNIYLPGPIDFYGRSLSWLDRLHEGSLVKGGTTIRNYNIELEEISWWEVQFDA